MTLANRMAGAAPLGLAMLIGLSATPAEAGYVVTLEEVGSNVIATGMGPIDLTGLSLTGSGGITAAGVLPSFGIIITGPPLATADTYLNTIPLRVSGPTSFGRGTTTTFASTGNGTPVGIEPAEPDFLILAVPAGYASGDPLSDTSTYDNATFASLGVAPGTYEWTWGTGPDQNFTLDVVVPEPSNLALLGVALAGLPLLRRRSRASG